ncbi:hypothetical protein Pmani_022002 [Petrolisthes manimaculis]|uniref:Uncharacterized protein n=1 Tax=Petrolisthes manimaculis TaxID=1843537 RepID=A0AAE1U1L2_9EUCA|nr:hypothetical protein Pmani_022002 [Petrolisthes manimaculis]
MKECLWVPGVYLSQQQVYWVSYRKLCGGQSLRRRVGKQEVRRVAAILHASVINKLPKGVSLTKSLEETWSDVMRELEAGVSKGKHRWALTIATWTCKALILRGAEGRS